MAKKLRPRGVVLLIVLSLVVAACGGDDDDDRATGGTTATTAASGRDGGDGDLPKMAMIFGGPINDADFNAIHYEALQHVGDEFDIETVHSEEVSPADAERVARQYINDDFEIIALQQAAYLPTALTLANEFPDLTFLTVTAGQPIPDHPENLWVMGLDVTGSDYVLGYLAAKIVGGDGEVAFLAGLEIPPLIAGANAMFAGARAAEPEIGLDHAFTADFNDPVKGRQAAGELIRRGAGAIVMHLNAAMNGAVQAIEEADAVWMAHYTDKSDISADTFVASMQWDMNEALETILRRLQDGEAGGTLPLLETMHLSEIHNVEDEALIEEVQGVLDDVLAGEVDVPAQYDSVTVPE